MLLTSTCIKDMSVKGFLKLNVLYFVTKWDIHVYNYEIMVYKKKKKVNHQFTLRCSHVFTLFFCLVEKVQIVEINFDFYW